MIGNVSLMSGIEKWVRGAIAFVLRLRVVRAALLFSEQKGGLLAAAITFRALFSVFAAVAVGFSIAAIWLSSRDDLWQALIDALNATIPGLVSQSEGDGGIISADDLGSPVGFSVAGIVALGALVWASLSAIGNLRTSIRMMAGTSHDTTMIVWLLLRDLLFAASVGVLLVATAVMTFVGSAFATQVLEWVGLSGSGWQVLLTRASTVLTTFILDAVIVAWLFRLLSGVKAPAKVLWAGALLGGVGLTVLQQLSGLFVGGATNNPLLGTFTALIALLLWFNFSAQVILIACGYIIVGTEEHENRLSERYGSETFAQRKVRMAERDVRVAVDALEIARNAEKEEREKLASRLS
jgi:membrane protein